MTVGSLRMMPCPRAYTSVLAVPRSMARSLARAARPLLVGAAARSTRFRGRIGARRDRAKAPAELVDARVHPAARSIAHEHDRDAERARHEDEDQERHQAPTLRTTRPARARSGCSPSAQSEPSAQCSFFQIGTLSLTRSMQASAAA